MRAREKTVGWLVCCACLLAWEAIPPRVTAQAGAGEWTWMSGSSTVGATCSQIYFCGQVGVYGTLGTPAESNNPSGRSSGATWSDNNGHIWLFGGAGFDSAGNDFFLNDLWEFDPSANEWTWVGGSNLVNQAGVYGTLGTPATSDFPGARRNAAFWTGSDGRFWLFGGWGMDADGFYSALSDLWRFDPVTKQWTWMSGSDTINQPSVYGTLDKAAPGNQPGGRYEAATWTDSSGGLWLFGGYGYDANGVLANLNDLWRFDPSTNEWTWMGGKSMAGSFCPNGLDCGYAGVYGTLGVPAAGNIPGSRTAAFTWTDATGHFWIAFGGGFDDSGTWGQLDDIWEFDAAANEWTWMGGYNTLGPLGRHAGVYGTLGIASTGNMPGSRQAGSGWIDSSGHFWLFGGSGWDSLSSPGDLNDVWEFDPSAGEWAWMGGTNTAGTPDGHGATGWSGVYGTLGTPAAGNIPGGRESAMSWTGKDGRFWLFGGSGFDSGHSAGFLNDLWVYQPGNASPAAADFSVSATPSVVTVGVGQHVADGITVTPTNGFNSLVSFSCSGLPAGVSCSFSPATVAPTNSAASTTLTLSDTAQAANTHPRSRPLLPAVVVAALLCCFRLKKPQRTRMILLPAIIIAAFVLIAGCESASGSNGGFSTTSPTTATVTVIATSGSLQHSTTISLTVN